MPIGLPALVDFHGLMQTPGRSLLDCMGAIPGGEDIAFDPPKADIAVRPFAFD